MTLGLIGIVLSLVALITLAYRGVSIIIAAPISAFLALVLSGSPLLASYTEIYMPALAGFLQSYFPMFLTGAIFGVLMTVTGYAEDIAKTITGWIGPKRAMLATVLTASILTYGGISVFVAVFVMFPLARELFRAADIPRRLIPATIALGILTFTMTALPGSPQIQNIIPGQFFHTSSFAAPIIGLIGAVLMFSGGMLWLEYRKKQLVTHGGSFEDLTELERKGGVQETASTANLADQRSSERTLTAPKPGLGPGAKPRDRQTRGPDSQQASALTPSNHVVPFIPIITVIAVNFSATAVIFPAMNWGYLADDTFGGISLSDRTALWAVLSALLAAIVVITLLNLKNMRFIASSFTVGAQRSMVPIFNTASEVGYGAVIASLAAFAIIRDGILGVSGNALVSTAVSTSVISGVTGSASGGMTIALNALGDDLQQMAIEQGIAMETMHRITAMASGGLDSMPHNGAVITLLMVCGMTHRESYKDVAVITLVIPVAATALLIGAALLMGGM